jgi:hypothetical protein
LKILSLTAVILFLMPTGLHSQDSQDERRLWSTWSLPKDVLVSLRDQGHLDRFDFYFGVNPYYVTADFNGGGLRDAAIQVMEKPSGKRGVLIWHREDSSVHVLGGGNPFGNGGDDWYWLGVWRATDNDWVPDAKGDVLYVEKPEAAGGRIWWDGAGYNWTQAGD